MGDEYFYALGRNDELFCHDCYRYVIAILDHAANEPLYFSLKFNVDRGTSMPLLDNVQASSTWSAIRSPRPP